MKKIKKLSYKTRREDGGVDPCPNCINHDVTIGAQTWTGCNANVAFYSNGDPIPQVTDPTAWASLTTGAWCYYNNDPANEDTYGKLYNWYAVNDPRGLAPIGYHVPTDAEWTVLTDYLGGLTVAGGAMKEEGFCHWLPSNTDATNTSLFTGLPGGWRVNDGYYSRVGRYGYWWSSTENNAYGAWHRYLYNFSGNASSYSLDKKFGLSVRFIKDELSCPDCIDHDVTIGTQTWTGCNLNTAIYRDGSNIPFIDNAIDWNNATTGAWSYYNNDPSTEATYGKLYNWYAATDTLHGGIAPLGYHVPTDIEWTTLIDFLGGETVAGGAMKEEGFCHWASPNIGATNSSGFSALPAGSQEGFPATNLGYTGYWWSSTEYSTLYAWYRYIASSDITAYSVINSKNWGLSIRLIKDEVVTCPDVLIDTQEWTSCNTIVSTYRNGDPIPYVSDPTSWATLTTGAWCYYDNDPANEDVYGKLYNWYAITDPRGIAPVGYHVPTQTEWDALRTSLGGESIAGGAMKEAGLTHWQTPNTGATNSSGFRSLPGGMRSRTGVYSNKNIGATWHSSTQINAGTYSYNNYYNTEQASFNFLIDSWYTGNSFRIGRSLRFIKGEATPCPSCEEYCHYCVDHDVDINGQTWTGCNANVAFYSNGDLIPQVTNQTDWANLTTGAWCYYNNNPETEAWYGKLYNWYAVNDPRGIAPTGYHVPSELEWNTLITALGGSTIAGGAMKEEGLCHWDAPNTGATNSSGFSALGSGVRTTSNFYSSGRVAGWWSSTGSLGNGIVAGVNFSSSASGTGPSLKQDGYSLRFIKDELSLPEIVIGTQTWTNSNLDVSTYRNGDTIPYVSNITDWANLTTGAWCWYNNDPANGPIYGKLYNWYAITDPRGLAPMGYHMPTDAEWTTLTAYLGGNTVAGGAMKEAGLTHWASPNTGATNTSLFTGLPGGYRYYNGFFNAITTNGYWWSSTESSTSNAWLRNLYGNAGTIGRTNDSKINGYSVRLIKD